MVTKNSASFIFVGQAKEPTRFYRRRLQDARIWNRIRAQGYEDAAANLCYGFAYLCWGGRAITSSWCERVSTSFNPNPENLSEGRIEYLQHCRKDYLAWADECQKHGIKHRAAMDILFFILFYHSFNRSVVLPGPGISLPHCKMLRSRGLRRRRNGLLRRLRKSRRRRSRLHRLKRCDG